MTQVVFDLGDRKTGSTSIQNVLRAGAWRCASKTLAYPYGQGVHHIPLARTLTDPPRFEERPKRFEDFDVRIDGSGADVAVISAEQFETADPADLHAAIEAHMPRCGEGARCIAYVRPHADRILSGAAERIKSGGLLGDLEQMHARALTSRILDYTPRFKRWRAVFGDRFELRPMIRDRLVDRDVVRDFFTAALGVDDFEILAQAEINTSLSLKDLVMVREFWRHARRTGRDLSAVKHSMGWAMGALLALEPAADRTRLRLHPSPRSSPHGRGSNLCKLSIRSSAIAVCRFHQTPLAGMPVRSTLRGAVSSFQVLSALLTA